MICMVGSSVFTSTCLLVFEILAGFSLRSTATGFLCVDLLPFVIEAEDFFFERSEGFDGSEWVALDDG